jgi:hypothetical protein
MAGSQQQSQTQTRNNSVRELLKLTPASLDLKSINELKTLSMRIETILSKPSLINTPADDSYLRQLYTIINDKIAAANPTTYIQGNNVSNATNYFSALDNSKPSSDTIIIRNKIAVAITKLVPRVIGQPITFEQGKQPRSIYGSFKTMYVPKPQNKVPLTVDAYIADLEDKARVKMDNELGGRKNPKISSFDSDLAALDPPAIYDYNVQQSRITVNEIYTLAQQYMDMRVNEIINKNKVGQQKNEAEALYKTDPNAARIEFDQKVKDNNISDEDFIDGILRYYSDDTVQPPNEVLNKLRKDTRLLEQLKQRMGINGST